MGNPHLLRRVGRVLGMTRKVEEKPSPLEQVAGRVIEKGSRESRLVKVKTSEGEEIEQNNLLAWIDYEVGQRVSVNKTRVYAVASDYVGGDFSEKVEVGRTFLRTDVSISPSTRQPSYNHSRY